ncbi:Electron transfer flavoprotein alpha-subunit [Orbilia ellipsospora]|uniref:Probable electron transfer flavoprotein subunit alpha n=1 Tax=Orbilia ellipsospora TaxID=2528407 RepID=A0AAV9X6B0_9PEZI
MSASTLLRRTALYATRPSLSRTIAGPQFSQRLASTLAIFEQRDGKLAPSAQNVVTAAKQLGNPVVGFVAGKSAKEVAEQAANIEGVDKVVYVANEAYEKGLPESYAPLVAENAADDVTHIISMHSAFGKNVMPRLAALLDVQQISDVVSIESPDTFVRPIYAGNAISTVQSRDTKKLITIRGTAFGNSPAGGAAAEVVEGKDSKHEGNMEWVREDLAVSDRPDLDTASKVVSGGRGLKDKENFDKIMIPLADAMGAAIGASRAAVDSGFADNSLQVGQTGKVVAPELYLSVGISGAIQHLAGMKDSKVIAAINKDADAPIFQVADVGLVADLFKAVPELTEKLKK